LSEFPAPGDDVDVPDLEDYPDDWRIPPDVPRTPLEEAHLPSAAHCTTEGLGSGVDAAWPRLPALDSIPGAKEPEPRMPDVT